MRELIVRDDRELRRIEKAIAAIRQNPAAARTSQFALLRALEAERDEQRRILGRGRRVAAMAA